MSTKLKILVEITIDNPTDIKLPLIQSEVDRIKNYVEDAINQPRLSEKQLKQLRKAGEEFENPPSFAQQMYKLGLYHDAEVVEINIREEHDTRQ